MDFTNDGTDISAEFTANKIMSVFISDHRYAFWAHINYVATWCIQYGPVLFSSIQKSNHSSTKVPYMIVV